MGWYQDTISSKFPNNRMKSFRGVELKMSLLGSSISSSGGTMGSQGCASTPNSLIFLQFSPKSLQSNSLTPLGSWRPRLENPGSATEKDCCFTLI